VKAILPIRSALALAAGLALSIAVQAAPLTKVIVADSVAAPLPVPDSLVLKDSFAASSAPAVTFYDFVEIYLPATTFDSWSVTALDKPNQAGLSSLVSNLYQGQVSTVAGLSSATLIEAGGPESGLPSGHIGSFGKAVELKSGWYTLEITGTTLAKAGKNLGGSYGGTFSISPVPEPETYAMLAAGLGLLGAVRRRRGNPKP
jgi:hypothetical protein